MYFDTNHKITICTRETQIFPESAIGRMMQEGYGSVMGGHLGQTKTCERIGEQY